MFNSLRPLGLQNTRLPCPSPTSRAYPNSCPSSLWCHPTILSSVVPFSPCLQSFPTSGSFSVNQFFASGGQSIRVSASASVLPMNIQDWLDLLAVLGTLKSLLQHCSSKAYKIMNIMSINNSWGCWSGRVERTMLAIAHLSAFYYVRKSILTIILGMVFITAS